MTTDTIKTTARSARRLAVAKQRLSGRLPSGASREEILQTIRELGYIQRDSVNVVAPSHILSIWARIGNFQLSDLEKLLWEEKKIFVHWTPMASLVLTEDYLLYNSLMKRYPDSLSSSWGTQRTQARKFMSEHMELGKRMLGELEKNPLMPSEFKDYPKAKKSKVAWTHSSDITQMLHHLHMSGEVMVVGHQGNNNVWGLSEKFLPEWTDKREISEEEFEREASQRAIRALGTATPKEINFYFVRGRYNNLKKTLAQLQEESLIHRITVEEFGKRDERYVHDQDIELLDSLGTGNFEPRMSLLPPFDNLICSTDRTSRVFGFNYVREQFLPKEKRRYGTYVLPILLGDEFIGRIDPRMDYENSKLLINSVHAEENAPADREVVHIIRDKIEQMAEVLGADEVKFGPMIPEIWSKSLH